MKIQADIQFENIKKILCLKFHVNHEKLEQEVDMMAKDIDQNLDEKIFDKFQLRDKTKLFCVEIWYNKDKQTLKDAILGAAYFPFSYENMIYTNNLSYCSEQVGKLCTKSSKYGRPLAIETFIGQYSFCDEISEKYGQCETENGLIASGKLYMIRSDLHNKYKFKGYNKYIVDLKNYVNKNKFKQMQNKIKRCQLQDNIPKKLKFMKEQLIQVYTNKKDEIIQYMQQHLQQCDECKGQFEINEQKMYKI